MGSDARRKIASTATATVRTPLGRSRACAFNVTPARPDETLNDRRWIGKLSGTRASYASTSALEPDAPRSQGLEAEPQHTDGRLGCLAHHDRDDERPGPQSRRSLRLPPSISSVRTRRTRAICREHTRRRRPWRRRGSSAGARPADRPAAEPGVQTSLRDAPVAGSEADVGRPPSVRAHRQRCSALGASRHRRATHRPAARADREGIEHRAQGNAIAARGVSPPSR
jgi:hypothetical protein